MIETGQIYICKDFFFWFFTNKDEAIKIASTWLTRDHYKTEEEIENDFHNLTFYFDNIESINAYTPNSPILFLQIEDDFYDKSYSYALYKVIWNEKIGWMPMVYRSFEKHFSKL
jgi:hypothetical protein